MISHVLDLVYPSVCQLCGSAQEGGSDLCEGCVGRLHEVEAPYCNQCGECFDAEIEIEFICPNCHGISFQFEFARAALHADSGSRKLIHDLKYGGQLHLADDLARLTGMALSDDRFTEFLGDRGLLVPVPLHWSRKKTRRFNQAEEIAVHLAKRTRVPMAKALQRTRRTESQTHFSRSKRLKNLKGAFRARSRYTKRLQTAHVILIDDVFTTGATANECARVLRQAGAKRIAVLTPLRG